MAQHIKQVALFTQDMSLGAFSTVFSGLSHALAENGIEQIELLTVKGDMATPENPFPAAARHVRLKGGGSAGAVLPLARHLERSRPDVLISGPILPNLAATSAMLLARRWRGRLIISHHHPLRLARGQSWKNSPQLARLLYRFAHGSFAVSPTVRDEAITVARLDPARVACIPNALAPAAMPANRPPHPWLGPEPGRGPVFVTLGRLEPVKNLPLLLQAFVQVADPLDARLLILGGGSEEESLRRQVAALGLEPRVQLPGHVQAPRAWLGAADAFVLASDEEGFGQVLVEAMAEGLPVISTDAAGGGVRFVLDEGRAGLLVPPGDPDALAGAMRRFGDPAVRQRHADLGRARVEAFLPGPVGAALLGFIGSLPERSPADDVR